ncbi:MAG TPA: DUF2630 family protein [Actinospica sp.]|jgi:hypothetical protein|nr:DUF2630 family protein [Actinospica sp.]
MADSNADLHRHINELIEEEHRLRENDEGVADAERRRRLEELETELDRLWDLLRQRQARREWDQDPSRARERPGRVVENYEN